jgi:GntR family negative regulator for fad regulon and positive regulator of fabA
MRRRTPAPDWALWSLGYWSDHLPIMTAALSWADTSWEQPPRPAEWAESRLVEAMLDGRFPPGSALPPERELAGLLGVTRPTLREALQRLARDGWLEIRQGRPTRVRDYWEEGGLGVLDAIARHHGYLPEGFVEHLLEVRLLLAPTYARLAVEAHPGEIAEFLAPYERLADDPAVYAAADWDLHHRLTVASGNPVFVLILNGFSALSQTLALVYFRPAEARRASDGFYRGLLQAAADADSGRAESLTREVMAESIRLWRRALTDHHRQREGAPVRRAGKD